MEPVKRKPKKKKATVKTKVARKKKTSPLGVYERPKSKAKPPKPTKEGFSQVWCYCTAIYKKVSRTTKECKCGWSKDHKHCSKCGGTVSVG